MTKTSCRSRHVFVIALVISLALHASLLMSWWGKPTPPAPEAPLQVRLRMEPEVKPPLPKPQKAQLTQAASPKRVPESSLSPIQETVPASLPAPTAEEWQLASTYTPRNSKRYRHTWGQQVRSMMGTAVEGPDQGAVRFRIEIAPDGKITKVEELWSTSEVVSKLARETIRNLPPLPPIPTGKPLMFEQTISFQPYETGWPPSYKLDCLPEPLPFNNPFAWNGSSPPSVAAPAHRPPPPDGCPPDSTEDTIEEEERSFERQMDQWRWAR
ncbi:MAG: hypothetical protein B7X94_01140 [Hydrogenophilales bacterium 17-62-8]|nr:MAG: hypothetical protein B7X94_01140 [Hydrogenophilales bacterium 17-62-8]